MDTQAIAAALQAEISRLSQALSILTGGNAVKRRGRPRKDNTPPAWVTNGATPAATAPASAPARKKRTFTAKQRREQALRMKKYWAAKKKAAKKAA
jgi:hypothetical protein